MPGACFICQSSESEQCQTCRDVWVCSEHRLLHSRDEDYCFPYRVGRDAVKGRILLTSRAVRSGELLFSEYPMVAGPSRECKNICIICLRKISKKSTCSSCGFSLFCSESCSVAHSASEECDIFSGSQEETYEGFGKTEDLLGVLVTLRCLLLRESNPEKWKYFEGFSDHLEELRLDSDWTQNTQKIVEQLHSKWKLEQHFSRQDIEKVEAILYINALEQPISSGAGNGDAIEKHQNGKIGNGPVSGKAFFPITSLCSHDCVNNTFRRRIPSEGEQVRRTLLETRAKVDIEENQEITLHYASGLKGRRLRRKTLFAGWLFHCGCQRCHSPAEMGSHLSTLLCDQCGGHVLPAAISGQEDPSTIYTCEKCGKTILESEVAKMEGRLIKQIESISADDIEALENFLDQSKGSFHPRHCLVLIIKWLLIISVGRKPGYLNHEAAEERLNNKVKHCQEYLEALDIIDPGISHNRGRTLWELYSVQVYLLHTRHAKKLTSREEFQAGLESLLRTLEEANSCLRYSESGTFEHKIHQLSSQARTACKETLTFIDFV